MSKSLMNRLEKLFAFLVPAGTAVLFLTVAPQAAAPPPYDSSAEAHKASHQRLLENYGNLPLQFEKNQGQTDPEVKFLSRGRGYTLFLTPTGAVLTLRQAVASPAQSEHDPFAMTTEPKAAESTPATVLQMKLRGANPDSKVTGLELLPGKSNYFIGNEPAKWRTNVPHYTKVKYQSIYPGIDLMYYGTNQRQLEYGFIVTPGADPSVITLVFEGADRLEVDAQGHLALHLSDGEVRFHRPYVYQEASGERQEVGGGYLLKGEHEVAFEVAAYDASKPLIIDPVLAYSTYLGGGNVDQAFGIAVDTAGNTYVTGITGSTDFPTVNALQPAFGGVGDAFVTKLNPAGSALVYSTYLGGSGTDMAYSIAVDSSGNAYVTGETRLTSDFPTVNPWRPAYGGGSSDAFVAKLNPTGSSLVYSTYLGGGNQDEGFDIAVDPAGNAYVAGRVFWGGFPTTPNAYQPTFGGGWCDGFVTKLDPSGSPLYSTYLGGGGGHGDGAHGIAVNTDGNAYVTGGTTDNFPTVNPLQGARAGWPDAFVTKLKPDGSELIYSTYLGGSGKQAGAGIAVDTDGNAYVTGYTSSTDFPTANALQPANAGSYDAFVTKLNPAGSALVYSTYLGGSGLCCFYYCEQSADIAVDTDGNAYVAGFTCSTDFPTVNAVQPAYGGGSTDAFVTKLNPAGSALVYSTYLGGSGIEAHVKGIAVDSGGNAYVTGFTSSTDFPTANPLQPAHAGGTWDGFVAKLVDDPFVATQELIAQVVSLNLQQGIENSLDGKLETAAKALDDLNENNDVAAVNALQAFINAVEAQRGDKITEEQADLLAAAAEAIIAQLTGG